MSKKQTTNHIFMVRPSNFGFNDQTAKSNAFQINDPSNTTKEIKEMAREEFDNFVDKLRSQGINIIVGEDSIEPKKPDAVFPNNWITFHENGLIITYPMFAPYRRREIDDRFIHQIGEEFEIIGRIHLENFEKKNLFLEGTGSMIFDRVHQIAYACLSPRTELSLFHKFCNVVNATPIAFEAVDGNGQQIYHTNVMMAMGDTFVVICLDTIRDKEDLKKLKKSFKKTKKEIINISLDQMMSFAGNMLQVENDAGKTFLVMSEQAFRSLRPEQIEQIERHTHILYSPIPTIETYGGGSARCMMAEVFLEKQVWTMVWKTIVHTQNP